MKHRVQIISAPSILGLKPTGVEQLPQSLLGVGLADKLKTVEPVVDIPTLNDSYNSHREPVTKCLNPAAIQGFSLGLMKEIESQIAKSAFPLVLGGDCSILIGIMAGLKTKGNYGLIFLDGHADFYQPEKSTTGEVADMDLAIVTGRGPDILTDINNLKPYVEDRNVIHIGQRDTQETKEYGSQDIKETDIKSFDLAMIKSAGLQKTLANIVEHINKSNLDGFWIHFDTDVVSDEENPAVDYRLPGGLTFNQVGQILTQLIQTGKIKGLNVTIFNPALDKDGEIAVQLSDCLVHAFD
ncbi:arginase family protein [Parapedobacter pyrenivorans]|uniref:arginase family protein n=1 Tax=Parapedobacter pyrenivorans TaxID=1305674 RepID=UPI0033424D73